MGNALPFRGWSATFVASCGGGKMGYRRLLTAGLTAASAVGLASCVTPYQPMGLLGGVSATQISGDTFQITARGNGYTDPDAIQRYALRKAAETTLAAGFDYFAVGEEADRSRSGQVTYGSVQAHHGWASGFSVTGNIFKPGQTVLIRCIKGDMPKPLPPGTYNAHEVVQYLSTGSYMPPGPTP